MTGVWIGAVNRHAMAQRGHVIDRRIAAGEPVGHHHIEHVGGREALRSPLRATCAEIEITRNMLPPFAPLKLHDTGTGFGGNREIDELPVRTPVEARY